MSNRRLSGWQLLSAWLPALLGVAVIVCESTDQFSSANTSAPLRHVWEFCFGPVSNQTWLMLHHHIRKTGHVVGYGLLSGLLFRAWFLTIRQISKLSVQIVWICSLLALSCTFLIGSADEMHQRLIPSRSSSPWDVAMDMGGALAAQLLIGLFFMARSSTQPCLPVESNPQS